MRAPEVVECELLARGVWSVSEIFLTGVVLHGAEKKVKVLNETDKTLI